jgi:hypothetical protein
MIESLPPTAIPGAVKVAYDLAKELLAYGTNIGKKEMGKLSVDFEGSFKRFLDRNYKQYSKIKTLINPATPFSLEKVFVSPLIEVAGKHLDEDGFLAALEADRLFVITGMGGSGKSVFMKHLLIRYYNEARGRIPFLIELRNLPKGATLKGHLFDTLRAISKKFDEGMFEYSLESGKFIFLFDGFDEIDADIRPNVASEIQNLTFAYDNNIFVVSSRPDSVFNSWHEFHVASMKGFTKTQAIKLLRRIPYDKNARSSLIELISKGNLYETHSAYLANPLLCTIMLLTFDQVADIPNKMHLFFSQTFDVLFFRHDATKGTAFRRKFSTELAIDDFRNVLAAFSAFTYWDHGPSMRREEAIAAASKAIVLYGQQDEAADFLNDLCMSLSLLIKEADLYSYIHRSFQEYFVAVFLSTRTLEDWGGVLEKILSEKPNDQVFGLLSDINRDRVEKEFLLPRITLLCDELRSIDISRDPLRAFKLFYLDFSIGPEGIAGWTVSRGSSRPAWHYLWVFIEPRLSYDSVNSFDWKSYTLESGLVSFETDVQLYGPNRMEIQPTNEYLIGTPMATFLHQVRDSAMQLESELKERAMLHKRLLSDSLFK